MFSMILWYVDKRKIDLTSDLKVFNTFVDAMYYYNKDETDVVYTTIWPVEIDINDADGNGQYGRYDF